MGGPGDGGQGADRSTSLAVERTSEHGVAMVLGLLQCGGRIVGTAVTAAST